MTYPCILADVVWPALYLTTGMTKWWLVGLSICIETVVLAIAFPLSRMQAAVTAVVINLASATVGVFAIAIAGIGLEIFPGLPVQYFFHVGTFNPATWVGTVLVAIAISSVIELWVVKWWRRVELTKSRVISFVAANAITVGIAMWWIWRYPPQM